MMDEPYRPPGMPESVPLTTASGECIRCALEGPEDHPHEFRAEGRASATFWLPRIEAAGLPVPQTVTVPYDHAAAMELRERGNLTEGAIPWETLERALVDILTATGKPQAFLRTDLASAKHDGPGAYAVHDERTLERAVWATVEDNEMKFWLTGPQPQVFLVREWLYLEAPFRAFDGHPIAREFRFFTETLRTQAFSGQERSRAVVRCLHPYWPPEAIKGPDSEGWREQLADISTISRGERDQLARWAAQAADACAPYLDWSVDFAHDVDGKWWLIDMAPADESWHPEHEGPSA